MFSRIRKAFKETVRPLQNQHGRIGAEPPLHPELAKKWEALETREFLAHARKGKLIKPEKILKILNLEHHSKKFPLTHFEIRRKISEIIERNEPYEWEG
ncbi:MAG: hypothetical protein V1847_02435 [Candidatus Diapherotrites archaeon]